MSVRKRLSFEASLSLSSSSTAKNHRAESAPRTSFERCLRRYMGWGLQAAGSLLRFEEEDADELVPCKAAAPGLIRLAHQ